jgi:ribosomal protein L37AE/L43A
VKHSTVVKHSYKNIYCLHSNVADGVRNKFAMVQCNSCKREYCVTELNKNWQCDNCWLEWLKVSST